MFILDEVQFAPPEGARWSPAEIDATVEGETEQVAGGPVRDRTRRSKWPKSGRIGGAGSEGCETVPLEWMDALDDQGSDGP